MACIKRTFDVLGETVGKVSADMFGRAAKEQRLFRRPRDNKFDNRRSRGGRVSYRCIFHNDYYWGKSAHNLCDSSGNRAGSRRARRTFERYRRLAYLRHISAQTQPRSDGVDSSRSMGAVHRRRHRSSYLGGI